MAEALRCTKCGSNRYYKDGLRYTNIRYVQRYLCRVCGYRFSESSIKVNVTGKVGEVSYSGDNDNEVRIASGDVSNKKVNDGLPFTLGKDVSSHNTSIAEKSLNGLPFYNSSI